VLILCVCVFYFVFVFCVFCVLCHLCVISVSSLFLHPPPGSHESKKEMANEAKRIMREQNLVRLQRNEVMLINITDETPDSVALLQQFYQDRLDQLQEMVQATLSSTSSPSNVLIFFILFILFKFCSLGQRESPRPPGQNVLVERPH
jgi:hypothetical protein